jgi:hypothetical protein
MFRTLGEDRDEPEARPWRCFDDFASKQRHSTLLYLFDQPQSRLGSDGMLRCRYCSAKGSIAYDELIVSAFTNTPSSQRRPRRAARACLGAHFLGW